MLPISEQYLRSICEIKTLENRLLGTGTLSNITDGTIQIRKDTEGLPTLHCGTLVKIYVCHQTMELKVLIGKIYLSSPELIQMVNVQNLTDFERRNFFRLSLNIHTQAYPMQEGELPDESVQLFQISITDLSLSGFFVRSKKNLNIGDCFVATLPLTDARVSFACKVQRCQKVNGRLNGYGCAFLDNSSRQYDQLCKYIFEMQREEIKRSRRSLY